jgi:ADP-ribose pyrophosphatase
VGSERVIESRRIYDGRICALREDTVKLASGGTAKREIVEHADVVAMVPLDSDGNVLLVRQFRLAAKSELLEVPAGIAEDGEDIEEAAQRELQEEVGYRAGKLERIAGLFVSPGFCEEFVHVFLATELVESRLEADDDEHIEVVRMPVSDAVALVHSGEIRDGKSVVGLLMVGGRAGT